MLRELRFIVTYIKGLMAHTEDTWDKLAEGKCEEADPDYMLTHFYWPLFGISASLILLLIGCGGLFGDGVSSFNLEVGMKAMVEFVVVYGVGPMLASMLMQFSFRWVTALPIKREETIIFAYYTMSTLIVLDVCCSVFPNLEFLTVSKLYMIYIVAAGVDHYLKVEVREHLAVTTGIFCLILFFVPQTISFLIHFIDKL